MINVNKITPIIMAGGSGSRLWPLSRKLMPKQFLNLLDDHSLLQNTLARLSGLSINNPIVITNEEHRFIAAEQLRNSTINDTLLLLEPESKNTAPAIALGALLAQNKSKKDTLLLVLAADHLIYDAERFQKTVENAVPLAEEGKLVTFGIEPTYAETGYGYIKKGEKEGVGFNVEKFVEKPSHLMANKYFNSGCYLWNSGMFLMRADKYLEALEKYAENILKCCKDAFDKTSLDLDFIRIDEKIFSSCPSDSIDYAVMEKSTSVIVVPLNVGWSDIGSWSSLWKISNKDENGNVISGDVVCENSKNSLIKSTNRLISAIGMDDTVIIDTKDALLVVKMDQDQDVKKIVNKLRNNGRMEVENHREVYRPWGKYDSIDAEARYQVKRITVVPGQKLSVQMHHHRSEHWIVVSGTALVGINGEEKILTENQSVYIPLGAIHYLSNPGKIPLELIEVQSGAYLGEDDIVRFDDIYGRYN